MIIATTEHIAGREIVETLGLVKGNTIRAKHIGKDILAGLKSLVGGEIKQYTEALNDARTQAEERMVAQAQKLGADAIVGARYATAQIMPNAAEILAYGTAVKLS